MKTTITTQTTFKLTISFKELEEPNAANQTSQDQEKTKRFVLFLVDLFPFQNDSKNSRISINQYG